MSDSMTAVLDLAGLVAGVRKDMSAVTAKHIPFATAMALTNTARAVQADIKAQLPSIFNRPTRFTISSIRYQLAPIGKNSAAVYVSDDGAKGLSPRKYLGPEIGGGLRRHKRSEGQLIRQGIMRPNQWLVPGKGIQLDDDGNIRGTLMRQIMSRLAAFGQEGYSANANDRTKRRLKKQGLAVRQTGTDYFVAKSKQSNQPLGIYQIMGKGIVKPVLIFANKAPTYQPIFHFEQLAQQGAAKHFLPAMTQAFAFALKTAR